MPELVGSRETRESAHEVKFLVDSRMAERIRAQVRSLLSPDPYAAGPNGDEYRTTTLYFDTPDYAVYGRIGSHRRAKFRIRRYEAAGAVFLERKLRTTGLLCKRRSAVREDDLRKLRSKPNGDDWSGRWFHERIDLRRLSAVCQVTYRRTARVGTTDHGPIRLTLDDELAGVAIDDVTFGSVDGAVALGSPTILEMKFRGSMPAVFRNLAADFGLEPARVSKYRLAIEATRPFVVSAVQPRAADLESSNA